ncbi:carbamoyltransferase C-terminal domain-containing protein [Streptosporangium sp. NPDC002524]|uniref:carbamoyltransferase family protein n=1 Tax=Streptosporangium sp. NPDC002524 TaxID=3154537 RepID=UPI00332F2A6D
MVNALGFLGHPHPGTASREPVFAGWDSGWYHNSAAATMNGRGIVAAAEEERFSRNKHTGVFPAQAIGYCVGETRGGLDVVAFGETGGFGDLRDPAISVEAVRGLLETECGLDTSGTEVTLIDHHTSHAYSAAMASGLSDALVVTVDGFGDGISGSFRMMSGGALAEPYRVIPFSKSLGRFYSSALSYLGYGDGDEYKVMGLAPYGDPDRFAAPFAELFDIEDDGGFAIAGHEQDAMFQRLRRLGPERAPGSRFAKHHADIAAALQAALEKIFLHVLDHEMKRTGTRAVCFAGGVAHNSSMLGKLARELRPDELFVQPAADDAGIALGAAYAGLDKIKANPVRGLGDAFLGPGIDESSVGAAVRRWRGWLSVERSGKPVEALTRLLAEGAVVGVARGRMEFGPRALGNRSILADPRPAENRDRVNRLVKSRESFRPFAPAAAEEDATRFFDLDLSPSAYRFMTLVSSVRPRFRSTLAAVTHVDGTARVQTVSRETNPFLHALLRDFGARTGVPVLLNTSLNNHREPIVMTAEDAIAFLLTSGIDCLLLGADTIVRRAPGRSRIELLRESRFVLRRGCFAAAVDRGEDRRHVVVGPGRREIPVGRESFLVLTGVIPPPEASDEGLDDLFRLWTERVVDVVPGTDPTFHSKGSR